MNSSLLFNSMWALKHLVLNSSNSLKMSCLDELGPGWLKQIICNGTEGLQIARERESASNVSIGMGTPNAAGMQVDLLNAVESEYNGSSQTEDDEGDVRMSDSEPESRQQRPKRTPNPPSSRAGGLLTTLPSIDGLSIQKEGLEIIRNLACGQGAPEMIDFLFQEFGQDKLFDILRSKLCIRRPGGGSTSTHPGRGSNSLSDGQSYYGVGQAMSEVSTSALYILIHIAAGSTRHRQILIAQTELLKSVIPFFSHEQRELRVCCAWLCINLTWKDEDGDEPGCRSRAMELAKLGYLERLKSLENDTELDVRERTKAAIKNITDNLRSA